MNKKLIFKLVILFVFAYNNASSQTKTDFILNKLKTTYFANESKENKRENLFFNKSEGILDLDGIQIPLLEVKCTYKVSTLKGNVGSHLVQFTCISEDNTCIKMVSDIENPTSNFSGVGLKFKSKSECYKFINMISELKNMFK